MSTKFNSSNLLSHSNNASLLQNSKMQNTSSERGEKLFKSMMRKRTQANENVTQTKSLKDSKKGSISSQKQDGKENKSSTNSSKMCYCSPTTHEGSFRCRLHRISATKKSSTEKFSNVKCCKFEHEGIVEFKPQLSRFSRVSSAEFGSHDSI